MKTISAIPVLMLAGILALAGCGLQESNEAKLRAEFAIPPTARVVSYRATPDKAGWFGREGLKIDIVFQVDPRDYAAYAASAGVSQQWLPLPIPNSFLRRMGAIASAGGRSQSRSARGTKVGTPGSWEFWGDSLLKRDWPQAELRSCPGKSPVPGTPETGLKLNLVYCSPELLQTAAVPETAAVR